MRINAGIIGAAVWGLVLSAQASPYSSMAVPGTHNSWSPTPSMSLVGTNVWICTQTLSSASGEFKFAANGNWTTNWGGNDIISLWHPPSLGIGSLVQGGNNLVYTNIATGSYVFKFYEQTATFDLYPVTPAANPSSIQIIGSFNGDGATSVGTMTNTSGYVWETTVELPSDADFLFKVRTATATNNWGALTTTDITSLPFSGGNPCGLNRYNLGGIVGGTFVFSYNFQSNTFSIAQTKTNTFTLASITAVGNFVAGAPPDINMEKISLTQWRSDFTVTNAARFTLSFIGRDSAGGIGRYWGMTNVITNTLPATGFMLGSSNSTYTNLVLAAVPGNYRITFNSDSGEYSVQQRYTASGGVNYLQNPSFENVSIGVPANWEVYHATSGEQSDFGAHSGSRCGVLMAKTVEADPDLGNFVQTNITLNGLSGQTFRVSAAFRTKGTWEAETVRIIVEWKEGTNLVAENAAEVTGLNERWQTFALECAVPRTSVTAKVLFKYDGAPGTGFLLVDDAEARISASRFQDFDAWNYPSFQRIAPDWVATFGKTIYNGTGTSPTGGVVISKYIEGAANNKVIEIFNGTADPVDLLASQYVLQQYNNGATSPSVNIALSGTLPPSECLVVSRSGTPTNAYPPSSEILAAGNYRFQTNAVTFNGDDAVVLRRGGASGEIVDRVGQVGTNVAGSLWSRMAADHSFQRKYTVLQGTTNSPTNEFSLSEWNVHSKDDLTELGLHYFSLVGTNAPYVPSGYSLLLNTNCSLMTPELDGGIGDISFYARAQGALAGSDIQLAIETSTSQTSTNWTTIETLSIPLATTNFTRFASFVSQSADSVLRLRHIGDGTTNRIRLDDVLVGEAYSIRRSENFSGWTNYLGAPIGNYSIAEWAIQNAQIGTNGQYGNMCAALYPDAGAVTSPTFEGGVGTVKFWFSQHPADRGAIQATILISTNDGATWTPQATTNLPAPTGTNVLSTNVSFSIYLPVPSSVRISATNSPSPFLVDNIEVSIPSISRTLTFDDFSVNGNYLTYVKDNWTITDTVIGTNLVYSGYSGRLRNSTVTSPYIDGIGPISFYYAQYGSDSAAQLTVEISSNAASWTILNSGIYPAIETQTYSFYNTNTNYHYIRISQTVSGKRILIDQIDVGRPAPVPSCTIAAFLSPIAPAPNEGFYLTADVIPRNGADILAVTGSYRTTKYGAWSNMPLTNVAYGSYRSVNLLPPQAAGTQISFKASAIYAGIGAYPGTTSYTSNTVYSTTNVIYISAVKRGTVWINELFYAPYEGEDGGGFWGDPYDHEYIELCGVAGTSITNWRVQLLFCSASDIQKNNGALYATYTIPGGTVLSNTANGFGFYVIGDQQLKDAGEKVNQVLTITVPTNVMPDAVEAHDHIHDRSGVVRLLDNYSNVVYSLSYGGYDSSSDFILAAQSLTSNTNSLSLSGTGSVYSAFSWNDDGALTIGEENTGQTLEPDAGLPLMGAWHTPTAVAQTSLQGIFSQFEPIHAAQSDPIYIHYAYTNADFNYAVIGGNVHYHKQGDAGAWLTAAKQNDFQGNYDTNGTGYAYLRMGPITNYTFDRLDTIEYVIEAVPNNPSLATAWLGSDGLGSSTAYTNLATAKLYPFRYTFPIADPIEIIRYTVSNTVIRLVTDGNDTQDPIENFNVRYTTNLLVPPSGWSTLPILSLTRTNEQNYFTVTNPAALKRFLAVEPLWP